MHFPQKLFQVAVWLRRDSVSFPVPTTWFINEEDGLLKVTQLASWGWDLNSGPRILGKMWSLCVCPASGSLYFVSVFIVISETAGGGTISYLKRPSRTSLLVHWLKLYASNARDEGLIPGLETKISHAMCHIYVWHIYICVAHIYMCGAHIYMCGAHIYVWHTHIYM